MHSGAAALSDAAEHGGGDITRFPSDSKSTLLTFLSRRKMAPTNKRPRAQGRGVTALPVIRRDRQRRGASHITANGINATD